MRSAHEVAAGGGAAPGRHRAGATRCPVQPQPSGPLANRILAGLPMQDRARLALSLQPVTLELGEVICEAGARMEHVYFPTTCVMSLLYTMEDGATAEMGLAGNDGLLEWRSSSAATRRPRAWWWWWVVPRFGCAPARCARSSPAVARCRRCSCATPRPS